MEVISDAVWFWAGLDRSTLPGRKNLCTVFKSQTEAAGEGLKQKYEGYIECKTEHIGWQCTLLSSNSELNSGIQFYIEEK